MRSERRLTSLIVVTALAAVLSVVAAPAWGADTDTVDPMHTSTSDVIWFPGTPAEGEVVAGASSSYAAYEDGISAALTTSGLEPGHIVTLWWVVFNEPELCTGGQGGLRCGETDLLLLEGPEEIGGTILYGGGHVIGEDGRGHFGSFLMAGDDRHVMVVGPGLVDPAKADVHLVLRDHGPAQPGLLESALESYGGGCTEAPAGTGEPGGFACVDVQFAFFEPTLGA